jgi:nitroreductase
MSLHHLSPDQLMATTRSVRKRLDLTKPVEMSLIEECVQLAMQAPTSSIGQDWQFLGGLRRLKKTPHRKVV